MNKDTRNPSCGISCPPSSFSSNRDDGLCRRRSATHKPPNREPQPAAECRPRSGTRRADLRAPRFSAPAAQQLPAQAAHPADQTSHGRHIRLHYASGRAPFPFPSVLWPVPTERRPPRRLTAPPLPAVHARQTAERSPSPEARSAPNFRRSPALACLVSAHARRPEVTKPPAAPPAIRSIQYISTCSR